MWIQVRSICGKTSHRIDGLSKLTKIEDLRELLVDLFEAPTHRQRLFYRGKQLEDGHTLFDYNVGLNEIVQLMVKPEIIDTPKTDSSEDEKASTSDKENEKVEDGATSQEEDFDVSTATYQVGDVIDCRDRNTGCWWEGQVIKITPRVGAGETEPERAEIEKDLILDDGFIYHIMYDKDAQEGYEEDDPTKVTVRYIRPRSHRKVKLEAVKPGDIVMVHYNVDDPDELGYWYDAIVTELKGKRKKELVVTCFVGVDRIPIKDCSIRRTQEIFLIEKAGTQINIKDTDPSHQVPDSRTNKPDCDVCKDRPVTKCKGCGCRKCGMTKDKDKMLLCDDCDQGYHMYCLNPPLTELPEEDEWYCPECKRDTSEVVQAGEKLKASKKKSKMASATGNSSRDWGRGMACVGRSKVCNIVPTNHFGPVPGVQVGMSWKFRVGASECGAHRPHVAGIAGRESEGAYSIVLSGGYEDDKDDGDTFTYTGSGGRDLSGNKRTAEQSCDQKLTRMNAALAKNCNAKMDSKNGAVSDDWKKGKPIRVLRNCKAGKHSEYAPEEGNRYDGIYKITRYWPEKGKSGFLVWRYELKRDDPIPAPWTKKGKKRIEELGFQMVYPDGYLEAQAEKEKAAEKAASEKKSKKRKRSQEGSESENDDENADPNEPKSPPAKKKPQKYELAADVQKLVNQDKINAGLWEQAAGFAEEGVSKYLSQLEELFCCICCQDLVFKPITTECTHNICKSCLQRSFKAGVYSCPACRTELGENYAMKTNETLIKILNKLYPGYEVGR